MATVIDQGVQSDTLTNVLFEEIEVGRSESVTRRLSQMEVDALALVAGDVDAFHLDKDGTSGHSAEVQAAGAEALISGLLCRRLPGPGARILEQNLTFQGSVRASDELTAKVTATAKNTTDHTVLFDCVVSNGDQEVIKGQVRVTTATERISYSGLATPELILRHNDSFSRLMAQCRGLPSATCAVVHPCSQDALLGAVEAWNRGLIEPVLVGPEGRIRDIAEDIGIDVDTLQIVSTEHSHAAAAQAVEMARSGEVECLMKGSLHTDELLGAVVSSSQGLRTSRRMSHVFVLDVPSYPRTLFITDAAINIYPDLPAKADITQNAIDLARDLGVDVPRVAILSAVETVNPKIPSTVDAAALCKMADRGQIQGAAIDGPLAFDNAVNLQAARTKQIESDVAGQADILVAPDLEAGNMIAKQLQYLAGADSAGIVLGTRVPIVLTSRADSVRTRLASVAVMSIVAHVRRDLSNRIAV